MAQKIVTGAGEITIYDPAIVQEAGGASNALLLGMYNVKEDFGAKGDGVTDDSVPIQQAINAAKISGVRSRAGNDGYTEDDHLGATVYFPPGRYMIGQPLIMPRSGSYNAHTVSLVGSDRFSTTLKAIGGKFPINRGLIEWESVARRIFGQWFIGLGFDVLSVAGARAFHYVPTNKASASAMFAEAMFFCGWRDLTFLTDVSRNPSAIRLEGINDYSRFKDLIQDSGGAVETYSTVLLHFDEDVNGVPLNENQWGLDTAGANFADISGITQGFRGGKGTLISGRVATSRISNFVHGVGAANAANGIRLKSSANTIIEGGAFEGLKEQGEILLDSCANIHLRTIAFGITEEGIGGVGLKVVNGRRIRWEGRFSAPGTPSFASVGGKLLSVDANTRDSVFENIRSEESFANEIEWLSAGAGRNRISYLNGLTGLRSVRDETPGGVSSDNGSPEGVIASPVGSLYSRADGGAGTSLYVKEAGAGNVGWVAK